MTKQIKERYDFLIWFIATILSLSAFKEELDLIIINLSFIQFSVASYLFWIIICFFIILQIYLIPYVLSSTKFRNHIFLNQLEKFSYVIILLIIFSPIIILILYILLKVIYIIDLYSGKLNIDLISYLIFLFTWILSWIGSVKITNKIKSKEKSEEISDLVYKEIKFIEMSDKLMKDEYYNQAFLEAYKSLEVHLFKILKTNDFIFRSWSLLEMLTIAKKYNIISEDEIKKLNKIRIVRNNIVHGTWELVTKEEIKESISSIKEIIKWLNSKTDTSQDTILDEADNTFFIWKTYDNLDIAKDIAKKENKPIFMVIYDGKSKTKSQLNYSLKYFTEYDTTKRLLHNNFIQLLLDKNSGETEKLVPIDDPLENCIMIILSADGKILKREWVYANPDEWLKRVNKIIEEINKEN